MDSDYSIKFRDGELAAGLAARMRRLSSQVGKADLMEVCGTHTVAIFRSGIREMMGTNIKLLSGPGCPVCVTPREVIDTALAYSAIEDTIVTTFGDMMRVPGSEGTLDDARASGSDVRILYSPLEALKIATDNADRKVIFTGVGFETTNPTVAATIMMARKMKLDNFAVLSAHRVIPPALDALCSMDGFSVKGFICPGHVSAVIGSDAYKPIAEGYGIPCVVTGFEPLDIMHGITMLLEQIRDGRSEVEIQYSRVVTPGGNKVAYRKMMEVFEPADARWRGLGVIPGSGLAMRSEYAEYDALKKWPVQVESSPEPAGCRCGDVLAGKISPPECAMFGKACNPEKPVGPCMVSSEGACAAHYRYG